MESTAVAAHVEAPLPGTIAVPRSRRAEQRRTRVSGGVLWILLVAGLLAGIVAMNVAVLRLNVEYDRLGRERVSLIGKNAELSSQLSTAAATARIQQLARTKIGLVPARADRTTYIRLAR